MRALSADSLDAAADAALDLPNICGFIGDFALTALIRRVGFGSSSDDDDDDSTPLASLTAVPAAGPPSSSLDFSSESPSPMSLAEPSS